MFQSRSCQFLDESYFASDQMNDVGVRPPKVISPNPDIKEISLQDRNAHTLKMLKDKLTALRAKAATRGTSTSVKKKLLKPVHADAIATPGFLELFAGGGLLTKIVGKKARTLEPGELYGAHDELKTKKFDLLVRSTQVKIIQ